MNDQNTLSVDAVVNLGDATTLGYQIPALPAMVSNSKATWGLDESGRVYTALTGLPMLPDTDTVILTIDPEDPEEGFTLNAPTEFYSTAYLSDAEHQAVIAHLLELGQSLHSLLNAVTASIAEQFQEEFLKIAFASTQER